MLGRGLLSAGRRRPDAPARARARRARASSRPRHYFAQVEADIRRLVGNAQIDTILDNIGLPYSGMNIALSDSATVGPMDGEILISLQGAATRRPRSLIALLRRELPQRFPELQFFFQPADIVDQVLELRSARADRHPRVRAPTAMRAYALATRLAQRSAPRSGRRRFPRVPGARMRRRSTSTSTARWPGRSGLNQLPPPATCLSRPITAPRPRRTSGSIRATASAIRWWCSCRPTDQLTARPLDDAGDALGQRARRTAPAADEPLHVQPRHCAAGAVAAQHSPGVRRRCRCPGPRPVLRRHRTSTR